MLQVRSAVMKKLYEKNGLLFAVIWIIIYCALTVPIRGELGDESIQMLIVLALISVFTALFVRSNRLEGKYGLLGWPKDIRKYLYFIPMWILSAGNLWGGFGMAYSGIAQVFAVISMALIGWVEEIIFRGFLFKAILKKDGAKVAIIISSLTFGIGHIVNLFAGQATPQTVLQVIFAVIWGFIFTLVFYKSGSLLPCIAAHSLVDVFSKFARDNEKMEFVYVLVTIVFGGIYCIYLSRKD